LYWKEFRLDAECDSTRHHSSKRQLGIDSNRRIILDAMEYKYVGITYWQLENESEFEDVVQAIRRAMGLRLRKASDRIRANRNALREYLVASQESRQPLKLI
jgi:predicted ATPase